MFYVIRQDGTTISGGHVADGNTPMCKLSDVGDVFMVQADGDELEMILRQCEGLPRTKARVQRWFTSDAQFICGNVKR